MIILILALFAFLSASTGGLLYYFSYKDAAFQKTESNAYTRLTLLTRQLSTHLSEHIKPVKTLSGIRELQTALETTNLETIFQANQILDHFTLSLDLDVSYILDNNGVTLCSSNRNAHDSFMDSRQFGNGPWDWADFEKNDAGNVTDNQGVQYLFSGLDVPHYPGWQIISLRNNKELEKQVTEPFIRVIGPVVFFILILAGFLVFILYQLAARELTRRKQAEKKLRLSEERYRHIYHKTPIMLHSIDTQGRIIHVSDHWVEIMGFARDEVIGEQLTRFFTKESRQFAINEIFPRFFSTGFCKDIPYTYIKKDKEKIDIMLSCYGVRNEEGQIIRSLAVSVDVTERNLTQKDLQIAKEKLSQYSLDLKDQVKKRTAQLEKAQTNLKNLSKNIIASQEREKELVARELHDHLGQVLTALRIDGVWIEKYLKQIDTKAWERAKRMSTLIDDTIEDVRDMAYRLRPRVLDDLGLTDALESLVSDFEKRSNVSCVFRHDDLPEIDKTLATALYRIGQEAVTNALRHSSATAILVELRTDQEGIVLTIEDDGCGFDTCNTADRDGFGLEGMKERANLACGKLTIATSKSQGTKICCKVKIKG